jgi:hypothetical protein
VKLARPCQQGAARLRPRQVDLVDLNRILFEAGRRRQERQGRAFPQHDRPPHMRLRVVNPQGDKGGLHLRRKGFVDLAGDLRRRHRLWH